MKENTVCIIQARVGSTRLPNKIFLDLLGQTVLGRVIERLRRSTLIDKIVVAAPTDSANDVIEEFIKKNFPYVGCFRGSENDVLDRYYKAAKKFGATAVIRITSDCPLIDVVVVDRLIRLFQEKQIDYAANILGYRTYPRGLDAEIFSFSVLEKMWQTATEPDDREHVTFYLRKHPDQFTTANLENEADYSRYRLTLDETADYELIKKIYQKLLPVKENFGLLEIVSLLEQEPTLAAINKDVEQKHARF